MWQFYLHFYELSVGENPNSANYFLYIQFLPLQLFMVIFMTPTREQLEFAAKAAGIVIDHWSEHTGTPFVVYSEHEFHVWQPVTNKSDSFNLMVACGMDVDAGGTIVFSVVGKAMASVHLKDYNDDKGLATMWAVFLCAVEIGRAM